MRPSQKRLPNFDQINLRRRQPSKYRGTNLVEVNTYYYRLNFGLSIYEIIGKRFKIRPFEFLLAFNGCFIGTEDGDKWRINDH